jgi:hypothetical protein
MASSEPLVHLALSICFDTQEFETVIVDDDYWQNPSPSFGPSFGGVAIDSVDALADGAKKRKRLVFADEENIHMSMTEAKKVVVVIITNASPLDVHPALYSVVIDARGFGQEALMVALSYLFDNRAQGNDFVQMAKDPRTL